MPRANPLKIALVAMLSSTVSFGGCSFLFVNDPPPHHEKLKYFDCTSSNVFPIIDTLFGSLYGLGTVGAVAGSNKAYAGGSTSSASAIAPFLLLTGAFVASAVVGYHRTSDCRDAQAALIQRLDAQDPAQAPPAANGWGPAAPDPWLGRGPVPPPAGIEAAPPADVPRAYPPAAPPSAPPVQAPPASGPVPSNESGSVKW